jgi:hypothetical protein
MTYEHAVSLPPGRYTVEAAVVDQEGNRASTSVTEIDNREQPGLAISDITLVRRLADLDRPVDAADPFEFTGKRVLPFVKTDLAAGMQPAFYFVVYPQPASAAKPRMTVQLLRDGRPAANRTYALTPGTSGAIPMVISERGEPGSYQLKVTVAQAGVSMERSLAYNVAGNASPKDEGKPAEDAGSVAAQPIADGQLASFRRQVRQVMTDVPNYTCVETITRTRRAHTRDFLPVDKIRLEVSSVAGKEMFARPGAQSFDTRDVTELVKNGMIGSGMFASLARNIFVDQKGTLKYKGKENVDDRPALRYNFQLSEQQSGFKLLVNNRLEPLAFKGSFWFDPVSMDLLRLEAYGDRIPSSLNVDQAVMRTTYARAHIGKSDALLPKTSELSVTYLSGVTERDEINFSGCHEYGSDSTIRFDAAPTGHN